MTFLSSWLLQIVLILLFAVVMDLIVPASSMRNYVKLVMGLVIMVTMLKPVSVLYDNKFDINRIHWPEQASQFASLDTIKTKAVDLQRDQIRQAEQLWNGQLEKLVKEQVEGAHPVEVTRVQARLAVAGKEQTQSAEIKELNLLVRPKSNENTGNGIQPVQPVHIQVEQGREPDKQQHDTSEKDKMLKQIKQELATRFQISGSVISIQWNAN